LLEGEDFDLASHAHVPLIVAGSLRGRRHAALLAPLNCRSQKALALESTWYLA
jgi:hypothetical protein